MPWSTVHFTLADAERERKKRNFNRNNKEKWPFSACANVATKAIAAAMALKVQLDAPLPQFFTRFLFFPFTHSLIPCLAVFFLLFFLFDLLIFQRNKNWRGWEKEFVFWCGFFFVDVVVLHKLMRYDSFRFDSKCFYVDFKRFFKERKRYIFNQFVVNTVKSSFICSLTHSLTHFFIHPSIHPFIQFLAVVGIKQSIYNYI